MYNNIAEKSLQEITSVVFHALNKAETKMRPILEGIEEIKRSVNAIGININNHSAFYQFSSFYGGVLGYKLGDILYLTAIEKTRNIRGDHPKYAKGYLWYSKNGFFITNEHDVIVDTYVNLNRAMADKSVYCGSPNGLLNVKQYWISRISSKYLPGDSVLIDAINTPEDLYSFDLFTLSAYSIILNAYKDASSNIDWLNYRLCAVINQLYNEGKMEQVGELYLFLRRIIYDPDLNSIIRLGRTGVAFDFNTYMLLAPPMDNMISKILYKHINTAVKGTEIKYSQGEESLHGWDYYWNNFDDRSGFSATPKDTFSTEQDSFKQTLFVKDALTEFCETVQDSETILAKIQIFFNVLEDRKDFRAIEKIFKGTEKILNSTKYKNLAKEKQEHYKMLGEKLPTNLDSWLKTVVYTNSMMDPVNADIIYSRLITDITEAEIFG